MLREDLATWHCGSHELSLSRPRIMGVLNVTPDSFSDGGEHADADAAIEWGMRLLDEGADIIDVGGESTRPGFTAVSPDEEAKRVVPVIRALVDAGAIVSVDTRHPEVARLAIKLGASILNDVTGFTNPDMVKVAVESDCGCIVMHAGEVSDHTSRRSVTLDSSPAARTAAPGGEGGDKTSAPGGSTASGRAEKPAQAEKGGGLDEVMRRSGTRGVTAATVRVGNRHFTLPEEAPIMRRVMGFLGDQARELMRAGVARERICVDPGPGFGKLADEDVVIQRATAKMVSMGYPVMCAVSRKRFVGAVFGVHEAAGRDAATAGVCVAAVAAGARLLRVHDVRDVVQTLDGYWAIAHPDPRRAFVALGSNVGDQLGNLARATALINAIPLTCVTAVSRAYQSEPAYGIADAVSNAVVEIRTELAPLVLLDALLGVEQELGRTRPQGPHGHAPRTIDCDLVWMEGEEHAGNRLRLPHPGLGERDFVLTPMEDLMHDPARFLAHSGVKVLPREERVGFVQTDLGEIAWE